LISVNEENDKLKSHHQNIKDKENEMKLSSENKMKK